MCLELALEGERLCKAGDCKSGVAFFQAAIQAGTDDLRILSAIYSQLGNAYFYLGDYVKAMQYHKLDLTLARNMGDKLGEAKSSGNLGNTLKVMGKFDEAMICCKRHLEISREIGDKVFFYFFIFFSFTFIFLSYFTLLLIYSSIIITRKLIF